MSGHQPNCSESISMSAVVCSFLRSSTWRRAMNIARNCLPVGIYWGFAPFQRRSQNPGGTIFFCCLYHRAQPIPSGVKDTSKSNGSPAGKMSRALICFMDIFAFLDGASCSNPSSTCTLSLSGSIRDGGTARSGIKIP